MARIYNILILFVMVNENIKAVAITGQIKLQLIDKTYTAANFIFTKLPIMIYSFIRSFHYYLALMKILQDNHYECAPTKMFDSMTLMGGCTDKTTTTEAKSNEYYPLRSPRH